MGRRIATEFETIRLTLGGAEVESLLKRLREANIPLYEHVLKNGDVEVGYSALHNAFYLRLIQERYAADEGGERYGSGEDGREPHASVQATTRFRAVGAGQFTDPEVAEVIRRIIAEFRGEALMKRVYRGFSVLYTYVEGRVVRIVERTSYGERVIYERAESGRVTFDPSSEDLSLAAEVALLKAEIDRLLDVRNAAKPSDIPAVDAALKALARRLMALEG